MEQYCSKPLLLQKLDSEDHVKHKQFFRIKKFRLVILTPSGKKKRNKPEP